MCIRDRSEIDTDYGLVLNPDVVLRNDTIDEMIDWMDTTGKDYGEERSGTSNLVDALDTITWWATYSFFHLDEQPIRNAYL